MPTDYNKPLLLDFAQTTHGGGDGRWGMGGGGRGKKIRKQQFGLFLLLHSTGEKIQNNSLVCLCFYVVLVALVLSVLVVVAVAVVAPLRRLRRLRRRLLLLLLLLHSSSTIDYSSSIEVVLVLLPLLPQLILITLRRRQLTFKMSNTAFRNMPTDLPVRMTLNRARRKMTQEMRNEILANNAHPGGSCAQMLVVQQGGSQPSTTAYSSTLVVAASRRRSRSRSRSRSSSSSTTTTGTPGRKDSQ